MGRLRKEESDKAALLGAAVEALPVALGVFDQSGRFALRSGALRRVLGERIPSRDKDALSRWRIVDAAGAVVDPPDWPAARALRGEINAGRCFRAPTCSSAPPQRR